MTGPPTERRSPAWPSGASAVVGVIGDPVRHSLSPLLHNAAFDALGLDWVSVAFPVAAGGVAGALGGMRALGIVGLSVTMPHKQDAAAMVDECTAVARRLGAVNCITQRAGVLTGDSTDGAGLVEALRRGGGFDPAGRRCVVIGAGGAARAVVLALADAGALEVVVVNRSPDRARQAAALAGAVGRVGGAAAVADAELVVQATSVGMAGTGAGTTGATRTTGTAGTTGTTGTTGTAETSTPVDPALLHAGQLVADLVYHPMDTPFLSAARERGADTVGGVGMLVHQAALAIERWTGQSAPLDAMWAAATRRAAPTGG